MLSSTEQSSNHSMPPTLSGPPSSPPTLLPQPKYKLMQNTSIAATYCPNGDRWVFMQDDGGNIQAAQYLHSVSLWNITSSHYNFTNAILGTALSATCVNTLDLNASCHANYGLPLGQYVSTRNYYTNPYSNKRNLSALTLFAARFRLFILIIPMLFSKAYMVEEVGATPRSSRPNSLHYMVLSYPLQLLIYQYMIYPTMSPSVPLSLLWRFISQLIALLSRLT